MALQASCPCGFSVTTPHGENELVEILNVHGKRIHNQTLAKDEIVKMAKEV